MTPLFEVVGKALKASPSQIGDTASKRGVKAELTVMVKSVATAHSDAEGVKIYVVVVVLSNTGLHVPVIPLFEVVGKAVKVSPSQIGDIAVKVGTKAELTVMVKSVATAHSDAAGVKV